MGTELAFTHLLKLPDGHLSAVGSEVLWSDPARDHDREHRLPRSEQSFRRTSDLLVTEALPACPQAEPSPLDPFAQVQWEKWNELGNSFVSRTPPGRSFIFELSDETVRLRLLATSERDHSTWQWNGHEWQKNSAEPHKNATETASRKFWTIPGSKR
jgi:hypothetical protein